MVTRVADLTVNELKVVIQEVVTQTLFELFRDPDEGLTLREEFASVLQYSLETSQTRDKMVSAENVAAKLGLSW